MTIDLRKHGQHIPAQTVRVPEAQSPVREIPRARTQRNRRNELDVRKLALLIGAGLLAILFVYGGVKIWGHFFASDEAKVRALVSDVSEHMLLPENEVPNVATVTDLHALEGQKFFEHAKEGDQVLMFMASKKAIIYRPSIDRIIEVGPITAEQ